MLENQIAVNGQLGGRLKEMNQGGVVSVDILGPLDAVRGKNLQLRLLDLNIMPLARTQHDPVRAKIHLLRISVGRLVLDAKFHGRF